MVADITSAREVMFLTPSPFVSCWFVTRILVFHESWWKNTFIFAMDLNSSEFRKCSNLSLFFLTLRSRVSLDIFINL